MNGLMLRHFGCDDRIDLVAFLPAGEYIALQGAVAQMRAGGTLSGQMFPGLVRFMRDCHMCSGMSFLPAWLFPGFLALALRAGLLETITGGRLGAVLGILVQLPPEVLDRFLEILYRFR